MWFSCMYIQKYRILFLFPTMSNKHISRKNGFTKRTGTKNKVQTKATHNNKSSICYYYDQKQKYFQLYCPIILQHSECLYYIFVLNWHVFDVLRKCMYKSNTHNSERVYRKKSYCVNSVIIIKNNIFKQYLDIYNHLVRFLLLYVYRSVYFVIDWYHYFHLIPIGLIDERKKKKKKTIELSTYVYH